MPEQIEYTKGADEHGFVYKYTQITVHQHPELLK